MGPGQVMTTTFMCLDFVPYQFMALPWLVGAASSSMVLATTGVTRLQLGIAGGGPVAVANLSTPITFTLPGLNSTSGERSWCSFWNLSSQAIDTSGCTTLPGRYPQNHTLTFVPGFLAPNNSMLAWAWRISGPLAASCSQTVLDCGAMPSASQALNPVNLSAGAVSCPAGSSSASSTGAQHPVLRVFYGSGCGLLQSNNALGCWWNALTQAFQGAGCVAAPVTRCMCRHLAGDFLGLKTPATAVATLLLASPPPASTGEAARGQTVWVELGAAVGGSVILCSCVVAVVIFVRQRQRYAATDTAAKLASLPQMQTPMADNTVARSLWTQHGISTSSLTDSKARVDGDHLEAADDDWPDDDQASLPRPSTTRAAQSGRGSGETTNPLDFVSIIVGAFFDTLLGPLTPLLQRPAAVSASAAQAGEAARSRHSTAKTRGTSREERGPRPSGSTSAADERGRLHIIATPAAPRKPVDREQAAADDDELQQFLGELGLEALEPALAQMGVGSVDDLQFVDQEMLLTSGARPVQAKKLLLAAGAVRAPAARTTRRASSSARGGRALLT